MTPAFDQPATLLPIDTQQAFDTAPWPRRWNREVDRNGRTLRFKPAAQSAC